MQTTKMIRVTTKTDKAIEKYMELKSWLKTRDAVIWYLLCTCGEDVFEEEEEGENNE